jgi:glycosyltransferase involved in cell wall biosynthesis
MATGLPVIVSRDEAFVEVLDREGACLATARTSQDFSDSLERLASEQRLDTTLSDRSRAVALRDWSLDVMTERYISLIRELL